MADDPDDFAAISQKLSEWREQEAVLRKKLKASRAPVEINTELGKSLKHLAKFRDHLDLADVGKLGFSLRQTIKRITIGNKSFGDHNEYRTWFGTLEFRADVCDAEPVTITDDDLAPRLWKRAAAIVAKHDGLTYAELATEMGIPRSRATQALKRCLIANRVTQDDAGRWTACSTRHA